MTTHHPNPTNGKSPSTSGDYADVTTHLAESALDMQTMHTRLADLLDQVSVSGPPAGEAPPVPQEEASSSQDIFSDTQEVSLDGSGQAADLTGPLISSAEERFDDIGRNDMSDEGMSGEGMSGDSTSDEGMPNETTDKLGGLGGAFGGSARDDNPRDDNADDNAVSGVEDSTENSAINIKGRTDGISIEVGAGSWRMLMVQLRHRLHQSSSFFRGGVVSLDVGTRSLTSEDLANAQEVLVEHGLKLGMVRTLSQETSQTAAAMGVSVTLDQAEAAVSQTASTNHESLAHFVYRGNLRSGQILRRAETILVLGDVNPGAHVESEADILVWGRLRGIAHAGAAGDPNAIVAAMSMEPTQLRITDTVAIMPASDERRGLFGVKKRNPDLAPRPEVAYIAEGTIVVEPWDESKPGGIMAFRRS